MSRRPRLTGRPLLLRRPRRFRRPRPRSLRSRLVLIACLLATSAVLVCQLAGLTVLRGWLTDQVDERLSHFRPPDRVARDMAEDRLRPPPPDPTLPSDYRVFFYDADGALLPAFLGSGNGAGPRLPEREADLELTDGRPATVPAGGDGTDSGWRVLTHAGPDGTRTVVALPLDTVDGATTKLLWLSLGLGVAVAVGVITLGNGAVRLGLRPLTRVEQTAQRITDGALELSVPVPGPDTEVGGWGWPSTRCSTVSVPRCAARRTPSSGCGTSWRTRAMNCAPRSPPCRGSPICCCTSRTCRRPGVRRRTP